MVAPEQMAAPDVATTKVREGKRIYVLIYELYFPNSKERITARSFPYFCLEYTVYAMASESESDTSNPISSQTTIISQPATFFESGMIPITGHKLTGHNLNQWSHSIMIIVCGKGKEDYLTGAAVQPKESSSDYRTWKVENNMVMSWLLNSMTNETGQNFMYYKTTKEIWDAALDTYSNKDNTSVDFEIKGILHDLRQGDSPVTEYYNMLIRYWQQLDMLEDVTWRCSVDGRQYKQIQEKERVYRFLLGLNRDLDEVRGRILSTKPLPGVREAFSKVLELAGNYVKPFAS
ncbi:hypothetical protein BUALT_Bualt11G0061300 [Buddleja alternifolia]|uniref:Retrotransposon gag domain-containing protein n=1 Tax=Buddleja alternifolia TaxID=168488 RepID=A0AAV6X065_9LAMI|nr:hypothetical protein BUALT_Bualt11G0061300 [Buddleja alternifolia]